MRALFLICGLAAALPLAAQTFTCAIVSPQQSVLRSRGQQELLAPVTIQCSGTRPALGIVGSISVSLNVPITSRVLIPETNASEALLLIDSPAPGSQIGQPVGDILVPNANVIQAFTISGSVIWQNLQLAPPGTPGFFSRTFTIVNVRANASVLNAPSNVTMSVSLLANPFVALTNPTTIAGIVADSGAMNIRRLDDGADYTGIIDACFGNKFPVETTTQRDFNIKFLEANSAEFRERNVASSATNPQPITSQNTPGLDYLTETGFFNTTFPNVGRMNFAGLATHGTRLMARITGIPAGVDVYVTSLPILEGTTASGISARLTFADADGNGSFGAIPPIIGPYSQLRVVNGSAAAVWEVFDSNPNLSETLSFGVVFSVPTNSSAAGNVRIQGGLAPLGAVTVPYTGTPNPLFGAQRPPLNVLEIRNCANTLNITTACPLPAAGLNANYNQPLAAAGGTPPYGWSIFSGALPPGLQLTTGGVVTGVAVEAGAFPFALRVQDNAGQAVFKECALQVVPTLTITTPCPLPDATVGTQYTQLLSAQGGRPPYQWTIPLGNFPPGLSLSVTGVISNVPVTAGLYDFTLRAADSVAAFTERECRIRVNGPFRVQPASLSFRGAASGTITPPQALHVTSASQGQGFSVRVSTNDNQPWLRATPSTGSVPGAVQVTADPRGLPPGDYSGTVTVAALNFGQQAQSVAVSLRVDPSPAPKMQIEPSGLALAVPRAGGVVRRSLIVLNSGNGQISYTTSATLLNGTGWLTVTPQSGGATPDAPGRVSVAINAQALDAGVYRARVSINSPATNETIEVPVTVAVSASREAILVSQLGLGFTTVAGGAAPPVQTLQISSAGTGGFGWDASASVENTSLNWLALSTASGNATPGNPSSLGVRVTTAGLQPGIYFGEVRIRAAGVDNSPRTVQVTLQVLPANANPGILLTAAGLTFVARQGDANLPAQTIQVHNLLSAGQAFDFSFPQDNRVFNVTAPDGRTVPAGSPARLQVSANLAGLGAGFYRTQLSAAATNDPRVQSADIVLIVLSGSATAASIQPEPLEARGDFICSSGGGLAVNPLSHPSGFRATAALPTAVDLLVTDRSGNPLVTGSVTMLPSVDDMPALTLRHQGNGRWTGTWIPSSTAGSPITLNFFAEDLDRGVSGCVQLHGVVESNTASPLLTSRGIVSSASFRAYDPIAPGAMLALFGQKLAGAPSQSQSFPLPFQLGTTRVSVAGVEAPLLYAGETNNLSQINLIAPYSIPINTSVPVAVRTPDGVSIAEAIAAEAQPGVFTVNQAGTGQGIIVLGSNPAIIADANNPVPRGEAAIIYAAGLGTTEPPVTAAEAAPSGPLARVTREVKVTIGGQEAVVFFAGLTPGFSGLHQLNVTVPSNIQPGNAVPVVVTVAGAPSTVTTMAVR